MVVQAKYLFTLERVEMMSQKKIALIGVALGWGAQNVETEFGPKALKEFGLEQKLQQAGLTCSWRPFVEAPVQLEAVGQQPFSERTPWIQKANDDLAHLAASVIHQHEFPVVLGGDHSIAIGTWSGVIGALDAQQDFGLIWFDAHMDAHTPQTSPSSAIHGMPVATLLGQGLDALVHLYKQGAKINPKHLVLIGIRSFEPEEDALLTELGVKVYSMEDVQQRGLKEVTEEALEYVHQARKGFGVTIDLDGFDPYFAPGVGSPETNGLKPDDFLPVMRQIAHDPLLKALEITEYNPTLDKDLKTAKLTLDILEQLKQ